MKEQDSNIRDLFQKSLEQHQVPVDPAAWSNIQAGIGTAGTAGSGAATTGFLGTTLGKIAVIAIVAAVGSGIYFLSSNDEKSENIPNQIEEPIQEEKDFNLENDNTKIVSQSPETSQENSISNNETQEETIIPAPEGDMVQMLGEMEDYAQETLIEYEAELIDGEAEQIPSKEYSMIRGDYDENRPQANSEETESINALDEDFTAIFTYQIEDDNPMRFDFNPEYLNGAEYHWNFGNSDESSTINPSYEYYDEGEYEVTLTVTSNGHSKQSGIRVKVYEPSQMFIPNVITPNNDNMNDYFDLEIRSKNISVTRLQVFDLGGNIVFESSDSTKRWNGFDRNGNLCPKGNYAFSFEAQGLDGRTYRDSGILRVN